MLHSGCYILQTPHNCRLADQAPPTCPLAMLRLLQLEPNPEPHQWTRAFRPPQWLRKSQRHPQTTLLQSHSPGSRTLPCILPQGQASRKTRRPKSQWGRNCTPFHRCTRRSCCCHPRKRRTRHLTSTNRRRASQSRRSCMPSHLCNHCKSCCRHHKRRSRRSSSMTHRRWWKFRHSCKLQRRCIPHSRSCTCRCRRLLTRRSCMQPDRCNPNHNLPPRTESSLTQPCFHRRSGLCPRFQLPPHCRRRWSTCKWRRSNRRRNCPSC